MRIKRVTGHAKRRVVKRSKIDPAPFLGMLQEGAYVEIERKTGSLQKNVAYLLFWSLSKSEWYVAVLNKTSRKIITVHELNNGHRWNVTDEQKADARLRAFRHQQSLREPQTAPKPARAKEEPRSTSDHFRFYARVAGTLLQVLDIPRTEGKSLAHARTSQYILVKLAEGIKRKVRTDQEISDLIVKDMLTGAQESFSPVLVRLK